jgi:trehalose-phosphatase
MSSEPLATEIPSAPHWRRALPPSGELAARLSSSPLLLALDIDGTLAPIAPTPEAARIPPETFHTLKRFAALESVQVAFVTGRAAADGRRMVEIPKTWTIGNHGIEFIDPTGVLRVSPSAETYGPAIADAARRLASVLAKLPGVLIEDKRWTVSIHVRQARASDVPEVEKVVDEVARDLALWVLHGKKIYELRPPVVINKGTALIDLAQMLEIPAHGAMFYAGDDRTDEDAFRALRSLSSNAVSVHVGAADDNGQITTDAEFVVPDPAHLQELLAWLLSMREADAGRSPDA